MNKKAINYLIRLTLQRLLGLLCFLWGSGFAFGAGAAIYFASYIIAALASGLSLLKSDPQLLAARGSIKTNSPKWDKLLLFVYWLLAFFVVYYIAGRGFAEYGAARLGTLLVGMLLQLGCTAISVWAMRVNSFLESTARVQSERAQTVCESGPYGFVRHPAYSAILLWCVSMPMIFTGVGVYLVCGLIAAVIILRTYLEDRMLKDNLTGYREYAKRVRFRLVPYVW